LTSFPWRFKLPLAARSLPREEEQRSSMTQFQAEKFNDPSYVHGFGAGAGAGAGATNDEGVAAVEGAFSSVPQTPLPSLFEVHLPAKIPLLSFPPKRDNLCLERP